MSLRGLATLSGKWAYGKGSKVVIERVQSVGAGDGLATRRPSEMNKSLPLGVSHYGTMTSGFKGRNLAWGHYLCAVSLISDQNGVRDWMSS